MWDLVQHRGDNTSLISYSVKACRMVPVCILQKRRRRRLKNHAKNRQNFRACGALCLRRRLRRASRTPSRTRMLSAVSTPCRPIGSAARGYYPKEGIALGRGHMRRISCRPPEYSAGLHPRSCKCHATCCGFPTVFSARPARVPDTSFAPPQAANLRLRL